MQQPFSAALLSSLSQQLFSAAFLSSSYQQLFSAAFLSSSSQQLFSAAFLSSSSQQLFSAIILLWSGAGGQLVTSSSAALLNYHLAVARGWWSSRLPFFRRALSREQFHTSQKHTIIKTSTQKRKNITTATETSPSCQYFTMRQPLHHKNIPSPEKGKRTTTKPKQQHKNPKKHRRRNKNTTTPPQDA